MFYFLGKWFDPDWPTSNENKQRISECPEVHCPESPSVFLLRRSPFFVEDLASGASSFVSKESPSAEEGLLKSGQPEDLVEKKNDSSGAGVTTFGLVAVGFFWVSGA